MTDNRRKKLLARWSGFKALYRGNPALKQETLYAIPEKLLSAIAKEAPSLLSAKEALRARSVSLRRSRFSPRQSDQLPVFA